MQKLDFKYKGILIDLDDTLCNTMETFREHGRKAAYEVLKDPLGFKTYKHFLQLLEEAKKEIKMELAGTASCHNRILYFKRIGEKLECPLNPELLRSAYREYWKNTYKNLKLYPKVRETLEILKKNSVKMAIVSDMRTEIQLEKIHHLNLTQYFDAVITSEEVGVEKPHPAIFLTALHKLQLLSSEVIMVGDSPSRDIEGAEALQIESFRIMTRKDRQDNVGGYFKPDHVINNFSEILNIITI